MPASLADIDRLIGQHLMTRTCRLDKDGKPRTGRCMCGHIKGVHARIDGEDVGSCSGSHGRCRCRAFAPYDYRAERQAWLKRCREFAFALLEEERRTP